MRLLIVITITLLFNLLYAKECDLKLKKQTDYRNSIDELGRESDHIDHVRILNPPNATNEFDFKLKNKEEYRNSIVELRRLVSRQAEHIDQVQILNPPPQNANDNIRYINLVNSHNNRVQLVMQNSNLYIVGFVSGGFFWRFQDHANVNVNISVTTIPLNLNSDYGSLQNRGNRRLEDVTISQIELDNSIQILYRYGSGVNDMQLARAIMTLIVSIPESVRFSRIFDGISEHVGSYDSNYTLGLAGADLLRGWDSLSEYANVLQNNPRSGAPLRVRLFQDTHYYYRNILHQILAVAMLCKVPSRPRSFESNLGNFADSSICPPNSMSKNILINNQYWPKDLAISILF